MKKILLPFLLFSCAICAVNYPPEEKRGIKRSIDEILPQDPVQLPNLQEQLVEAAKSGNVGMLTAILDNISINIDNQYADRNTLLMIAAEKEQIEVVDALLDRGADANLQNDEGRTALHIAVGKNYVPIVTRLLEVPDIELNTTNNNGSTALLSGIISESTDAVDVLLTRTMIDRGLDINGVNNDGNTPLKEAIEQNDLHLFNTLVELGAFINQMTSEGPLLNYAMQIGSNLAERMLEIPGLRVNLRDKRGLTPLMIAAGKGNLEIAKKLLEKGAQLQLRDNSGSEAFHCAAGSNSPNKNKMMLLLRPTLEEK